jgi:transposase
MRYELGVRRALVETRAGYVTMVRQICRSRGAPLPSCTAGYFAIKLRSVALPDEPKTLVAPLVTIIEQLDVQIRAVDARLIAIAEREPLVSQLMTAPGVALIIAIAFISVIDDARRFRNAHEVESYLGLVPSEYSTGDGRRIGAISKHGNPYLRSLLVEGAQIILRSSKSDDPLWMWASAVRARRGQSIAAVALARRLAGLLWAMWRDNTVYEPARVAIAGARGLRRDAQDRNVRADALLRAAKKLRRRATRTTKLVAEARCP